MKTKMTSTLAGCLTVLLAMLMSHSAKAQITCPYTITNALTCTVSIYWSISPPSPACNTICQQGGPVVIQPNNGTFSIPCASFTCGSNLCMVKISVVDVNGTSVGPISDVSNNGTGFATGTGAGGCSPVNVICNASGTLIN